jgi:hypothetical protein
VELVVMAVMAPLERVVELEQLAQEVMEHQALAVVVPVVQEVTLVVQVLPDLFGQQQLEELRDRAVAVVAEVLAQKVELVVCMVVELGDLVMIRVLLVDKELLCLHILQIQTILTFL